MVEEEKKKPPPLTIAIDGEGYTDKAGRHHYVYLAAVTATGHVVSELEADPKGGLFASEVLPWLVSLPKARVVGFSLGYDKSKWFQSLPNPLIHAIFHPEDRPGEFGPSPVIWDGYKINNVATKLSITETRRHAKERKAREGGSSAPRSTIVWDLFRFFQSSFVKALTDWKVGTEKERTAIQAMKEKRGAFNGIKRREKLYCQAECRLLAILADRLFEAHGEAGITLKNYYGPGSTAAFLLTKMNAEEHVAHFPNEMRVPVASAFFGGRFEQSVSGPLPQRIYSYDICSAYPYAMTLLPCMACGGKWRKYKTDLYKRIRSARLAIVRYKMPLQPYPLDQTWAALPYRTDKGTIIFPNASPGGWMWKDEYLAAARMMPLRYVPLEAWVYTSPRCKHDPPFRQAIQELYAERLRWGKEARGKVLKLGLNSCYGKSAQSVGSSPHRCLVRAGMITSLTRAKIIAECFPAAPDLLAIATDGVLLRRPLPSLYVSPNGSKALGSWEPKVYPNGVFLIRPGLRFELGAPSDDSSHTAARGIGVKTLHENRRRVLSAWRHGHPEVYLQGPPQFMGGKAGVRELRDGRLRRHPDLGRWVTPPPELVSFAPEPKRARRREDGSLELWVLPEDGPLSAPYSRLMMSPEAEEMRDLEDMLDDQPDWQDEGNGDL